jgi:hypothetical protein
MTTLPAAEQISAAYWCRLTGERFDGAASAMIGGPGRDRPAFRAVGKRLRVSFRRALKR